MVDLLKCGSLRSTLATHPLVLVDVFTEHCPPCRVLAPTLEAVAAGFAGRLGVVKLDAAECAAEADDLGVTSVPTLILFRDGQEVARKVGAVARPALEAWIQSALA